MKITRSNLQRQMFGGQSEADIQSKIIEVLKIKKYLAVRINSGVRAVGKRFVRFYQIMNNGATSGFPDLIAIKNNRILMIEVKSEKGKLRESQEEFRELAASYGNSILVAKSWEEVLKHIEEKLE